MSIRFTPLWKPGTSVRERELERSAQRSHAARVANANRRKKVQLRLAGYDEPSTPVLGKCNEPSFGASHEAPPNDEDIDSERPHQNSEGSSSSQPSVTPPTPQPTTILKRGNSDPFNSFVIDITPTFNRIITFARDSYFPSVTVPKWLRSKASSLPDPHAFAFGLSSTDSALAHVSTYGACLLRILPRSSRRSQVEDTCLQVRTQALERLRALITQQSKNTPPPFSLFQQVLYLFQGAMEARDFDAAKVHGRMLRHLLLSLPYNPTTTFLFVNTMHTMLEVATHTFQPSIVDFDQWHADQMKTYWTYAESLLPPYELEDVHPCISSPLLKDSLLTLRKWLARGDALLSDTPAPTGPQRDLISLWSHTRPVSDCLDLLKHFLTLSNVPSFASPSRSYEAGTTLEAALTLTLFCNIRKYVHNSYLDDTDNDLRDATHVLAPRLREVIEALLASTTHEEQENHAEALFWVYFTGAFFEQGKCIYQQLLLKRGVTEEERWWFTSRLAKQAKLLKLEDWEKAKRLLERFAHRDILEPNPESWWQGIFGTLTS